MTVQQPPSRNASVIGGWVFSHSGEFAPSSTDLRFPGRGIDFVFSRWYRSSLAGTVAELGRGWTTNVARRIESIGNDLVYHDGTGSVHRFKAAGRRGFEQPPGLYAVLEREKRGLLLRHRHGVVALYDLPDRGGRLRQLEDRNRNTIELTHRQDEITILDTLRQSITVTIGDGLIRELCDHAGRVWAYRYDRERRLVEVVRPKTTGFPAGTSVRYAYDDQHRLATMTSPNGAVVLVNRYDEYGRVVVQNQGDGAFRMTYEPVGGRGTDARRLRTTCRLPNGGTVELEHNALGNVTVRTYAVRRESFAAEDLAADAGPIVPVVTTTRYNANGEAVEQLRPAGNRMTWAWADRDADPRNHGNLLRVTELPADGVAADQAKLVTSYEHDPVFQLPTAVTDARGNVTRHRYDATGNLVATTHPPVTIQPVSAAPPRPAPVTRTVETTFTRNRRGQLLSMTAIDGSVSTYEYYPVVDPIGTRGPGAATSDPDADCGYLARITRGAGKDALRASYGYDAFGNIASVIDGKGNPSRLVYDALGRLERITGREPVAATVDYRYDANGNEVEVEAVVRAERPRRRDRGDHHDDEHDSRAARVRRPRPPRRADDRRRRSEDHRALGPRRRRADRPAGPAVRQHDRVRVRRARPPPGQDFRRRDEGALHPPLHVDPERRRAEPDRRERPHVRQPVRRVSPLSRVHRPARDEQVPGARSGGQRRTGRHRGRLDRGGRPRSSAGTHIGGSAHGGDLPHRRVGPRLPDRPGLAQTRRPSPRVERLGGRARDHLDADRVRRRRAAAGDLVGVGQRDDCGAGRGRPGRERRRPDRRGLVDRVGRQQQPGRPGLAPRRRGGRTGLDTRSRLGRARPARPAAGGRRRLAPVPLQRDRADDRSRHALGARHPPPPRRAGPARRPRLLGPGNGRRRGPDDRPQLRVRRHVPAACLD